MKNMSNSYTVITYGSLDCGPVLSIVSCVALHNVCLVFQVMFFVNKLLMFLFLVLRMTVSDDF